MRLMALRALVVALALPTLVTPSAVQAQGDVQSSPDAASLTLRQPPRHILVETSTSAPSVARGGRMTLYVDVAPKSTIHVYAEGAPDVKPVSLVVTPRTGVRLQPVRYPAAEQVPTLGMLAPVNAYTKPFRISQQVAVSSAIASGEPVVLTGMLHYQACDDRVCYPTAAVPLRWSFVVR